MGVPAHTVGSRFIELTHTHNIYISSLNLGSFSTLGPRAECGIVKQVLVSSDYAYTMLDNVVASHDKIDVNKLLLNVTR